MRCYIDQNPIGAGLVKTAAEYPHGSAGFLARGKVPCWLDPGEYGYEAGKPPSLGSLSEHAVWVVERRLEKPMAEDPLDELIDAAPARIRAWMVHEARVADGPCSTHCLISLGAVRQSIARLREAHGEWLVVPRSRKKDGWRVLELGLSRDVVGLSTAEASLALGVARSSAGHALLEHRRLLLADPDYSRRAAMALTESLSITFGTDPSEPD